MICVSISDAGQIPASLEAGARLLELRLDLLDQAPADLYNQIPEEVGTVVTCRPGALPDGERSRRLTEAIHLGASYLDLELESPPSFTVPLLDLAEGKACKRIISHHDFEATPAKETLLTLMNACYSRGADVAKIATTINEREDILSLLSLYEHEGKKVILGMGMAGRITRVMAPFLGSEFTFAAPVSGKETAPGQMSYQELADIYKDIEAL